MKIPLLACLAFVVLLTGCQLPATSKGAARQHQVGEPFTVNADFAVIARRWDELAVKPVTLDGTLRAHLQLFESVGVAEIYEGSPALISTMIELKRTGPDRTLVTAYQPCPSLGNPLKSWLEIIRSTPPTASAPKTP